MSHRIKLLRGLAILSIAGAASAQRLIHEWRGNNADYFGWAHFTAIGDVDQDGVLDLAIPSWSFDVGNATDAGRVEVFSGRSGIRLLTILGTRKNEYLGAAVFAPGDVDADGVPDLLVSAAEEWQPQWKNALRLYSGRTGQLMRTHNSFGWIRGSAAGDVDRDGHADYLIGDESVRNGSIPNAGAIALISGKTGGALHMWRGSYANQGLSTPNLAGDVDGDGVADFILGSSGYHPFSITGPADIVSGKDFRLLFQLNPTMPAWHANNAPGDVDADGLADVAASGGSYQTPAGYGTVTIHTGPNGRYLFRLQSEYFGSALGGRYPRTALGDVDGDGFADLLLGDPAIFRVYIYSGRTQKLLLRRDWVSEQLYGGDWLETLGDVDGDDFPDWAVQVGDTQVTRVRLYSGAPDGVTTHGTACTALNGASPRIGASFVPRVGQEFALNLSQVQPNSSAILLAGLSDRSWRGHPLPIDLAPLGMPGCLLQVAPDHWLMSRTGGIGAKGHLHLPFTLPNDARLRGATFYAQWIIGEPTAAGLHGSTTRVLQITIQ